MSSPRSATLAGMTPEQQFARELEVFRTEVETAAQFFYSYLAMREVAKHHKRVFRMFNEHQLFWNTLLGGVQTAALIAVGRVFDQNSTHNLDAVLGLAQRNRDIFSRASLGKRKQATRDKNPTGSKTTCAPPMNRHRRTSDGCESSSRNTDASTKPTTATCATNTTRTKQRQTHRGPPTRRQNEHPRNATHVHLPPTTAPITPRALRKWTQTRPPPRAVLRTTHQTTTIDHTARRGSPRTHHQASRTSTPQPRTKAGQQTQKRALLKRQGSGQRERERAVQES
jgi:hypothetical protein